MKKVVFSFALFYLGLTNSLHAQKASKKDQLIIINTKFGEMVAILYDETPKHKANFLKLAKEGFYDSLLFHRVIKDFMIQGGDPESKNAPKGKHLGSGGPGYTIDAEINPKFFHHKGALSAARMADQANPSRASSGSQFYIVQGKVFKEDELKTDPQKYNAALQKFFEMPPNRKFRDSIAYFSRNRDRTGLENYLKSIKPIVESSIGTKVDKDVAADVLGAYTTEGGAPHLDGQYTVFGKVIKGLDVIDRIATQPRDSEDRPLEDIRMTINVKELSKKKIGKIYVYKYPDSKKIGR